MLNPVTLVRISALTWPGLTPAAPRAAWAACSAKSASAAKVTVVSRAMSLVVRTCSTGRTMCRLWTPVAFIRVTYWSGIAP